MKTMARVSRSRLASWKARATSSISARFIALSDPGRFSEIVRTPSAVMVDRMVE